ncbi:THAP domain-containing protein 5-like [Linepithema humile]|uniref:THAP domain-containing protein 5-like n=1 Tax=Linepithema humile TaxID=83485 RepID=UPI00062360CC|nr:PREDICTED: THAP domain-containing protein 5-like [Linepithema humile]
MPGPYCVLCGKRDKSVSYHGFPRNDESRKKWLDFCGIDENVLSTATKLCSNHFEEDKLIHKSKNTFLKSNALPTITSKKRKKHQCLDSSLNKSKNSKNISEEIVNNGTVNDNISEEIVSNGTINDKIHHNNGTAFNMTVNDGIVINDGVITNGTAHITVDDRIIDETIDNEIIDMTVDNGIVSNGGISDEIVDKTIHCVNDIITDETVHMGIHHDDGIIINETETLNSDTCLTVNRPSTPPNSERSNCFQTPVKNLHDPRFVGAIRTPHLATPRKARRALEVAKRTIEKQRRKIKTLQQAKIRLVSRITTIKGLIKHLKQKDLLSETTAENLMVTLGYDNN